MAIQAFGLQSFATFNLLSFLIFVTIDILVILMTGLFACLLVVQTSISILFTFFPVLMWTIVSTTTILILLWCTQYHVNIQLCRMRVAWHHAADFQAKKTDDMNFEA